MFIATLFTVAKIQKQPKCLSTDEWIKKIYICTNQPLQFKGTACQKQMGFKTIKTQVHAAHKNLIET